MARDLGVSDQTIDTWRRQEQIDRGLVAGQSSLERDELAAAKRRIRENEERTHPSLGGITPMDSLVNNLRRNHT